MLLINLALLTASAVSTESRSLLTQLTLCVLLFFGFTVWINRTRYAKVIAALSLSVICGGVVWAAVFSHPTHERSNVDGPPYFLQSQAKMLMTAWSETSAFGYGIGSSHPATERLRSHLKLPKPHVTPPIWDNELVQVYVELGLVGFSAWYTLRIVLLVLSVRAVKEAARGDARSLYLSMALIQLGSLFFPFVMNATAGLLVTAVAGLSLSAKRLSVGAHTT